MPAHGKVHFRCSSHPDQRWRMLWPHAGDTHTHRAPGLPPKCKGAGLPEVALEGDPMQTVPTLLWWLQKSPFPPHCIYRMSLH